MRQRLTIYVLINIVVILLGIVLIFVGYHREPRLGGALAATGASMVASGIVALLYLAYRKVELREFRSTDLYHRYGLEGIHDARALTDYARLIQHVDRTGIDVLGFGLQHFLEDHGDAVAAKAKLGIPVRLLVIDPASPVASLRERAEGQQSGAFASHVNKVAHFVSHNAFAGLQARKYNADPGTMVFRIGGTMFVGPYFHRRVSRQAVTYEIIRSGVLFDRYQQHFDALWDEATHLSSVSG